ncbi:phage tail spike protein, partial [Oceanobacillus indicireducens]|uniref:phage tail spike protein n=1 Tax=Oceanobacillus indicireducens TaxID=1004261 RepID=UPI00166992CC
MSKIIIADGQTSKILDHIHKYDVSDNMHERDMSNWVEVFEFTAFADKRYAQHLVDRNRLIIPDEDGEYRELIIKNTKRYSGAEGVNYIDIISYGFYQDLVTAKTIEPGTTPSQSPEAHMRDILEGTEVRVGEVAYTGNIRTITRENKTDPFSALKSLANEFDLELDFRIEVDRGKIVRYADLVEHIGEWRGRTVEFGHDLQTVSRETDANNIVTALRVIGPEREDGTRLEVFVEDEDARNRWSRNGEHLVREYEPETEDQNITEERLRTLGRMELNKRVNALVTWGINVIDLEHVPGMQNKKIRYGDTIRVKDTTFNPPFYVEARIFKQRRNIFNPGSKEVELGDFIEYT